MNHNEPHIEDRDPMHELLCKVVFGEADEAEAREVQAALAASPELRAQKEQLEATAAMVRGSLGAPASEEPQLSDARLASVLAAAGAAQGADAGAPAGRLITATPWHRSPALRAAAVVAILAGGLWAIQRPEESTDADEVAQAEAGRLTEVHMRRFGEGRTINAAAAATRPGASDVDGLGYAAPEASDSNVDEDRAGAVRFGLNEADELGDVTNGLEGMASAGLETTGRAGSTNAAGAPAAGHFFDQGVTIKEVVADRSRSSWSTQTDLGLTSTATDAYMRTGVETRAAGEPVVLDSLAPAGFDVFTVGSAGPEGAIALPGTAAPAADPLGVTYRGPGDTIAPGAGGAPNAVPRPRVELMRESKTSGAASGETPNDATLAALGYADGSAHDVDRNVRFYYELPGVTSGWVDARGQTHEFTHDDHRCLHHQPVALPNETPRDMFFRFWGDNPYVVTEHDKLSTFAADVDTASFALAKRMLAEGHRPRREQIRTEEFVNFLEPDLAAPTEGTFALHAELGPSPFGGREDRYLLRLGVRAMEIDADERPPLALSFVVDTSGSMRENNRLELVKHAMRLLVDQLDARDTIAIARFNNDAQVVLPPTPATARDTIETALFALQPDGSTNAEAGLKLGYQLAEQHLRDGAQSRVVFLSDGVANVGQTDQDRIAADVAACSARGIFLNTIGVGMGNHNDVFLEQMANKGQGVCDYVGSAADARRAIVERFVGGFVTVAKDVKIQVEFDPAVVLRWRQLGYENRAVADRDFRNDAVDAGEIGAGHQVTCLYEVELAGADARREAPMVTARLRWKPVSPGEAQPAQEATELEQPFRYDAIAAASFRASSNGFRRAALAAQLAENLRDSVHTAGDSVQALGKELATLLADDRHRDTATVAEMCRQAIALGLKGRPAAVPGDDEQAHRDAYYDELIKSLGGDPKRDTTTADGTPKDPESRIRELIEGNHDGKPH